MFGQCLWAISQQEDSKFLKLGFLIQIEKISIKVLDVLLSPTRLIAKWIYKRDRKKLDIVVKKKIRPYVLTGFEKGSWKFHFWSGHKS